MALALLERRCTWQHLADAEGGPKGWMRRNLENGRQTMSIETTAAASFDRNISWLRAQASEQPRLWLRDKTGGSFKFVEHQKLKYRRGELQRSHRLMLRQIDAVFGAAQTPLRILFQDNPRIPLNGSVLAPAAAALTGVDRLRLALEVFAQQHRVAGRDVLVEVEDGAYSFHSAEIDETFGRMVCIRYAKGRFCTHVRALHRTIRGFEGIDFDGEQVRIYPRE